MGGWGGLSGGGIRLGCEVVVGFFLFSFFFSLLLNGREGNGWGERWRRDEVAGWLLAALAVWREFIGDGLLVSGLSYFWRNMCF